MRLTRVLSIALVCAIFPLASFSMGSRATIGADSSAVAQPAGERGPKPSGYGLDEFLRRDAEKAEPAAEASPRLSRSGYGIDDLR